jgi:glycogen synthase
LKIKQLKEKIHENEERLQKLMANAERIWQDTGLDSKDPSYLIEKTMRFELAQKSIMTIFSAFKDVIEDYKKLCLELEKSEE